MELNKLQLKPIAQLVELRIQKESAWINYLFKPAYIT